MPDKTLRFTSHWTGSFTQPPPAHLILRRRFMKSLLLQPSARFPQRHLWSVASYSRPIESTRQMIIPSIFFFFYLSKLMWKEMFTRTSSGSLFGFLLSVLEFLHYFALVSPGVLSVRVATRLLLRPAFATSALCS